MNAISKDNLRTELTSYLSGVDATVDFEELLDELWSRSTTLDGVPEDEFHQIIERFVK